MLAMWLRGSESSEKPAGSPPLAVYGFLDRVGLIR